MAAINYSYGNNAIVTGLHSFRIAMGDALSATAQKIKAVATSPVGQGIIGIGLGIASPICYIPLTEKILKVIGFSAVGPSPFNSQLSLGSKILLTPVVCILAPILEEQEFRGDLQEKLKNKFKSFYENLGFSDSAVNIACRATSIFFASVIFGAEHFANAIFFWCNPILFLPQVVAATIMGLMFGLAKELSGELYMPIGMHIGNNTLAWTVNIYNSL